MKSEQTTEQEEQEETGAIICDTLKDGVNSMVESNEFLNEALRRDAFNAIDKLQLRDNPFTPEELLEEVYKRTATRHEEERAAVPIFVHAILQLMKETYREAYKEVHKRDNEKSEGKKENEDNKEQL